jgi:hypothetical protein
MKKKTKKKVKRVKESKFDIDLSKDLDSFDKEIREAHDKIR